MTFFSSFSIEKPHFLILILLIVPLIFHIAVKFKKISRQFSASDIKHFRTLKISIFFRTFFASFSWVFAILALSEISFGSKRITMPKSGNNVNLVFDISYSMLAKDSIKNLSRLDAAKIFARNLVENTTDSSFSVSLVKGSGYTPIPETEDKNAVLNLIDNLSPMLMSSSGSSLSKGIESVLSAIPKNSPKSQFIWFFTDGDETDDSLEESLENAAKFGIPVSIIGFGKENESEITAGDGKTRVKTALRTKKLKEIAENASDFYSFPQKNNSVTFIEATTTGSARQLLRQLKNSSENGNLIFYEEKNVKRHTFFIFLAIIFLCASRLCSNHSLKSFKQQIRLDRLAQMRVES